MIIDFCNTCNSYDKNNYKKNSFLETECPKCKVVGLFDKHAYYLRNMIFFCGENLYERQKEILRVICKSCNSTHAVLPYDIVPYKLVSSICIIKLLIMIFIKMLSYEKVLLSIGIVSLRLISIYKKKFLKYINEIANLLRNIKKEIPPKISPQIILNQITSIKYKRFLKMYIQYNGKVFFMEKMQNKITKIIYIGTK